MNRVIVVSNRVADTEQTSQSGGLAVALLDALKASGGIWFGWDGEINDGAAAAAPRTTMNGNVTIATISLTEAEYRDYYAGFSNGVLWPVFHNRLDIATINAATVEGYRHVNSRFAATLAALLRPDDIVWVHDYHLIPLAGELRRLGVQNRIGFFLHIPFPTPDVFVAIPDHDWLMRAFLFYDLIGLQTASDVTNLQRSLEDHFPDLVCEAGAISVAGHALRVGAFPVGIDVDAFRAKAQTAESNRRIEQLNRRAVARVHVIGVDRLDYTKGLPERLRSFRRLLELYPENRKVATLMQIAPPTREDLDAYGDIRRELEGLSGSINGEFGDFDWTPVRYVHRVVPRDTLAALFRGSHVGLVTPLRDGMNLVAKEYVAAQDENDPGVLVLSRFAGAAEDLTEALIVNPYDADEVAEAMQRAIRMPVEERRERWQPLMERVRKHNAKSWREHFLGGLMATRPG